MKLEDTTEWGTRVNLTQTGERGKDKCRQVWDTKENEREQIQPDEAKGVKLNANAQRTKDQSRTRSN